MLYDLDQTLELLLRQELPSNLVGSDIPTAVVISFATPDTEFSQSLSAPAVNLFLYDIQENLELRSNDWRLTRQSDGTALREPPPKRVNCSYLITAWPRDAKDLREEHRLLGEVMKVLLRFSKLPAAVLQGSLKHQEPPYQASVLGQPKLQSLGEFWQAIGGRPKATLNYTVTISVPTHTEPETLPLAMQMSIEES